MFVSLSLSSLRAVSWKDVKEFINSKIPEEEKRVTIQKYLQQLWTLARNLIGNDERGEIIDDAGIYLLRLFLNVKIVMVKHLTELKKIFGNITSQMANKICSIVCDITPLLPDECIDFIRKQSDDNDEDGVGASEPKKRLWGSHIQCVLPNDMPTDNELAKLRAFPVDDQPVNLRSVNTFSMKYESTGGSSSKTKEDISKTLNRAWLLKHVNSELIPSFISILKSKKSNEELQNELIDMMGFEKFDVIQTIFEHRKQIIHNIETEDKKRGLKEKAAALDMAGNKDRQMVPAVASQVVVQSEAELNMKKQVRREEKRLRSLMHTTGKDDDDDEADDEIVIDGNTVKASKILLQQQQNLLSAIQRQPILNNPEPLPMLNNPMFHTTPRIKYPFVFDEQIEARTHVGFIAGSKLVLPDNVQRVETKMYDEIKIPANEAPVNLGVGDERVKISDLDEVGRMAFANTKELNRIQTVVFQQAYHSNDNMLVCAPTGAGKTNVAMLTIVHTIRAHIDQGIIHRDQFKIVYVAPMKALAAEMVENFGKRLKPLGERVHRGRELFKSNTIYVFNWQALLCVS